MVDIDLPPPSIRSAELRRPRRRLSPSWLRRALRWCDSVRFGAIRLMFDPTSVPMTPACSAGRCDRLGAIRVRRAASWTMTKPRAGTMTERTAGVWRLQATSEPDAVTGATRRLSRTFRGSKADAKRALQRLVVEACAGAARWRRGHRRRSARGVHEHRDPGADNSAGFGTASSTGICRRSSGRSLCGSSPPAIAIGSINSWP